MVWVDGADVLGLAASDRHKPLGVVVGVEPVAHARRDTIDAWKLVRRAAEDVVKRTILLWAPRKLGHDSEA